MTLILKIEHLFFRYDHTLALQDVNLQVKEKEFIGIFGPNGGGKTTLLKLIMGILTPDSGSLSLFGCPSQDVTDQVGYVPQAIHLDQQFPISSIEVVMMGCLSQLNKWGRFPKKTKEKALNALEQVGLLHKATAKFGTLSGGEAQRVLIARALVNEPKLLLLDEPTANVDLEAEMAIYDLLIHLNKKMTILMVTHDLQTIIDKVGRLLLVQHTVFSLKTEEVCEHFALGLYHTPLTKKGHFSF